MKKIVICIILYLTGSNLLNAVSFPESMRNSNLILHLSADCIEQEADNTCHSPANNSEISVWSDQTTNNFDAIAIDPNSKPQYLRFGTEKMPVIRFNSAQKDGMKIHDSLNITQDKFTIFVVDSYTSSGTSHQRLVHSRSGDNNWSLGRWNERAVFLSSPSSYNMYVGPDQNSPKAALDQFMVHTAEGVGANNVEYYQNGFYVGTLSDYHSTTPKQLGIANHGGKYKNEVTDGDVAEIIIFDRRLTGAEKELMHDYLLKKYKKLDFDDSYTISFTHHDFSKGTHEYRKKTHLSVESGFNVKFKDYWFWDDIDHQPQEIAWAIDYYDHDSPYFTLKNLWLGRYLENSNGSLSLTADIHGPDGNVKDSVSWYVNVMSAQGDFALINRSGEVLKINKSTNAASLVHLNSINVYSSDIFFNIHERFITMNIYPEDAFKYNDLLHLPNGLTVTKMFIPSPDGQWVSLSKRRFKIQAENHEPFTNYEFVAHPGFDVLAQNNTENAELAILVELNKNIDGIIEKHFPQDNATEIKQSILKQLSQAYLAEHSHSLENKFIEGMVWISPIHLESIPEHFATLSSKLDKNGKYLKVIIDSKTLDDNKEINFGFILKKTTRDNNGVDKTTFLIYDPSMAKAKKPN